MSGGMYMYHAVAGGTPPPPLSSSLGRSLGASRLPLSLPLALLAPSPPLLSNVAQYTFCDVKAL